MSAPHHKPAGMLALWRKQIARGGMQTALIAEPRNYRYAELDRWSDQLAARLQRSGVRPGTVVAVHGERSPAVVAALLAVLKCGACYVPLEPNLPVARRERILRDACPAALIHCAAGTPPMRDVVVLNALPEMIAAAPVTLKPVPDDPQQALYLLYTSGSSGIPKGVIGTQQGLLNRLTWQWQQYPYGTGERVAHRTALGFVDAVAELWGALLAGVPLVIISAEQLRDIDQFIQLIQQQQVTRLVLVPSLMQTVLTAAGARLSERWAGLRLCVSSGESLSRELAADWHAALPGSQLLNLYGMTEAAADASAQQIDDETLTDYSSVPLGRAIAGWRMVVLDEQGQPLPAGATGQIYLGGPGLAHGYYRRADLSAERFIPDPDPGYPGERLYATGDRGYLDQQGVLHYRGRADQQVKIRGHRIELSEVERYAQTHPSIAHSAALVPVSGLGAGELLLFVALQPSAELTPAALTAYLAQQLPDYMLPAFVFIRRELPLLHNGKIDRRALAAPAVPPAAAGEAPQTAAEQRVALIWQELLRGPAPVRDSRFLQLGGDSLKAALVVSRLRAEFAVSLSMAEFFDHDRLRTLAALLDQRQRFKALRDDDEEARATSADDDYETVEF